MDFVAISLYSIHLPYVHSEVTCWMETKETCKRRKDVDESKHNCLCVVICIKSTTCFGPFAWPSSGHKIYKEEKTMQYES